MQSSTVKVVFILLISHALAFPSGAPQSACDTMMPGHVFRTQSVPCPFVTQPEKTEMLADDSVRVVLKSVRPDDFFKGYMIIAFDESSNDPKPIGHFVAPAGGQTRSCRGGSLNAVTHSNSRQKDFVSMVWTPPTDFEGNVTFKTTFVEEFSSFWVKQPSVSVRVVRDARQLLSSREVPSKSDTVVSTSPTGLDVAFTPSTTPISAETVIPSVTVATTTQAAVMVPSESKVRSTTVIPVKRLTTTRPPVVFHKTTSTNDRISTFIRRLFSTIFPF